MSEMLNKAHINTHIATCCNMLGGVKKRQNCVVMRCRITRATHVRAHANTHTLTHTCPNVVVMRSSLVVKSCEATKGAFEILLNCVDKI